MLCGAALRCALCDGGGVLSVTPFGVRANRRTRAESAHASWTRAEAFVRRRQRARSAHGLRSLALATMAAPLATAVVGADGGTTGNNVLQFLLFNTIVCTPLIVLATPRNRATRRR